jgi:hypothetical protein
MLTRSVVVAVALGAVALGGCAKDAVREPVPFEMG